MQPKHKCDSALSRLRQDYIRIKSDPVPYVVAEPLPSNMLEWHYVIAGPENTPYEGGYYHGKLVFPREFPFKPPSFYMITPNGRFMTNTKLCLSISDFHPDNWNPAWNVATILTGLVSFMTEETKTLGSTRTTTFEKRQLAYQSLKFNLEDKVFQELFPDLCKVMKRTLEERELAQQVQEERALAQQLQEERTMAQQLQEERAGGNAVQFLRQQIANEQGPFLSALTDIVVIAGFAAFAFTVKYILKNISYD